MIWPLIIAAGAQVAGQAISASQRNRAKKLGEEARGTSDAAFAGNYGGARDEARQAARDAAMGQQMSLAAGSGTLSSQAAGQQAAAQRAPGLYAQTELAAARVGEGYASGANAYMPTHLGAQTASQDRLAAAEGGFTEALGTGGQLLSSAFGGGGGEAQPAAAQAPVDNWQPEPIQTPGEPPLSDERTKTQIQPVYPGNEPAYADLAQQERRILSGIQGAPAPSPAYAGLSSDLDSQQRRILSGISGQPQPVSPRDAQVARLRALAGEGAHTTGIENQAGSRGWRSPTPEEWAGWSASRGGAGGPVDRAQFDAPKPVTSTPDWLRPQGQMNVTTRDEGAMAYRSDVPDGATRTTSYDYSAQGTRGGLYSDGSPAEGPPPSAAGLTPRTPVPVGMGQNRPSGTLRQHAPHQGVDPSQWSPEERADFEAKNPDFAKGDNSYVREGAPGTGGMGGPPGAAPDQIYLDQEGSFEGEFAPWVRDREAAAGLSTGGALRRPTVYNDQPNAYSNRVKGSGGGFKQGVGYASSYDVPESYREMVRGDKVTGMVRVPILDFRKKVGLRSPGGGQDGAPARLSEDARMDAFTRQREAERAGEMAQAHEEAYDFVRRNEDTSMEEARALRNELLGGTVRGGSSGGARRAAPPPPPTQASSGQVTPFMAGMSPVNAGLMQAQRLARRKEIRDNAVVSGTEFQPRVTVSGTEFQPGVGPSDEQMWLDKGTVRATPGEAQVEPTVQIGQAQMQDPTLSAEDQEVMDRLSVYERSPAVAFEKAKAELLNPGMWGGNLANVSLEDLDPATRKAVEARSKEIQEGKGKVGSDERMKSGASPMSAAQVFEKTPGFSYSYKPEFQGASGAEPGPQVGIMAQDLEKTPAGRTVVDTGPDGMKRVDSPRLTLLNSAALNEVTERLKKLEKKRNA